MNVYQTESTEKTPLISGNIETGKIIIRGRSYPESAVEFYGPFKKWLEHFYEASPDEIKVIMDLDYFNTSTTAFIYDMIQNISKLKNQKKVEVIWKFDADDYDMIDRGEDLKRLLGELITLEERLVE